MELPETLRLSRASYFSWLCQDLTLRYLPRFFEIWIDSSVWLRPMQKIGQTEVPDLDQSSPHSAITSLILQDQLYYRTAEDSLQSFSLRDGSHHYIDLEDISTLVKLVTPHSHLLIQDIDDYYLQRPESTVQLKEKSHNRDCLAYDAQGNLYIYSPDGKLTLYTSQGLFLREYQVSIKCQNTTSYVQMGDPLSVSRIMVVKDRVLFVAFERRTWFDLETEEFEELVFAHPYRGLWTDHRQYLIGIKYDPINWELHILNLSGQVLNRISLGPFDQWLRRSFTVYLHPDGRIYLHADLTTLLECYY